MGSSSHLFTDMASLTGQIDDDGDSEKLKLPACDSDLHHLCHTQKKRAQARAAAIADFVFGHYNPSGRLSMTWCPESFVQQVSMTDMKNETELANSSRGYPSRTYRFYTGETVYSFRRWVELSRVGSSYFKEGMNKKVSKGTTMAMEGGSHVGKVL